MSTEIPAAAHILFEGKDFATVATLQKDGVPQLSIVWVERDGADVVFSTVEGRQKHRNLVRDPRCTVLVLSSANPYHYLEVRGTATMTRAGGRELIDRLAHRYRGWDRYGMDDGTDNVRVVVRVTPDHVVWRGPRH